MFNFSADWKHCQFATKVLLDRGFAEGKNEGNEGSCGTVFGIVLKLFTHGIFHEHFCKKRDSNMVIIVENNKQLVICFHYYIFVIQIFNFLCSAPIVGQRHYKTCTVLSYRFNDTKAIWNYVINYHKLSLFIKFDFKLNFFSQSRYYFILRR